MQGNRLKKVAQQEKGKTCGVEKGKKELQKERREVKSVIARDFPRHRT